MRNVHGWAFRLMREERKCHSSQFLTLTYATKNVPITTRGRRSLRKRDVQLFLKRLRKKNPTSSKMASIKYYACGEYGGATRRPHYHLILFNAKQDTIQPAWKLGNVHYGDVNAASVYYTLKYMMKAPKKVYRKGDPLKEFALMSKGLGIDYSQDKRFTNWHKKDIENRMYLNLEGGQKISMPRYYKDKIFNDEQREQAAYAGYKKAQEKANKSMDTGLTYQQRQLSVYMGFEFERLSRSKV